MLNDIIAQLEANGDRVRPIPRAQVRQWMSSNDPDVLGATYGLISNERHAQRVTPSLDFHEVFEFLLRYYVYCLTQDPRSEWANSRYSAGWDLVGWFVRLWEDHRESVYLDAVKVELGRLYATGDSALRDCLEHAVLEHLFEIKQIRNYFGDWQRDPSLRRAYDEAMAWVTRGGASPLTKCRASD